MCQIHRVCGPHGKSGLRNIISFMGIRRFLLFSAIIQFRAGVGFIGGGGSTLSRWRFDVVFEIPDDTECRAPIILTIGFAFFTDKSPEVQLFVCHFGHSGRLFGVYYGENCLFCWGYSGLTQKFPFPIRITQISPFGFVKFC